MFDSIDNVATAASDPAAAGAPVEPDTVLPSAQSTAAVAALPAEIEGLLQAIRLALAQPINDIARGHARDAWHRIGALLHPPPIAPIAAALPASDALPLDPQKLASIVQAVRGMSPDGLAFAITRLRAALPADAEVPAPRRVRVPIVPLAVGGARR